MPRPYQFCSDCGSPDLREFRCQRCGHRHFITPIPAAVAMILDPEERLLVIRRGHEPGQGLLGLPGGVIEPEETGEMAAARETREEVGLNVPVEAFRYFATLNNRYLFQGFEWPTIDLFFMARVASLDGVTIDPTEVMEWMPMKLAEIPLEDFAFGSNAEAIRRLIAAMHPDSPPQRRHR